MQPNPVSELRELRIAPECIEEGIDINVVQRSLFLIDSASQKLVSIVLPAKANVWKRKH